MSAQDSLGPQFPVPGQARDIEGVPHHFVGWHVTDQPEFKVNPQHEHYENMLGAERGEVYASHEPSFWAGRGGDHAAEIWKRTKSRDEIREEWDKSPWKMSDETIDKWHGEQHNPRWSDQDVYDPAHIRVGRTHPVTDELLKHTDEAYKRLTL